MPSEPTTDTTCGKIDCVNPPDFDDIVTPLPVVYFNAAVSYTLPACPNPADQWSYSGFLPFWVTFDDTLGVFSGAAGAITSSVSEEAATAAAQAALDSFVNGLLAAGTLNCGVCNITFYSLVIDPTGSANDQLVFTAINPAIAGTITIAYVNPGAPNISLLVTVVGTAISVRLATNGGSVVTTTAAQVKAAVQANVDAAALVTVADWGTSTGADVVAAYAADALWTGGGDTFDCYDLGSMAALPNSGIGWTGSWIVSA